MPSLRERDAAPHPQHPIGQESGILETRDAGLLIEAFQVFTQASSSLESAFRQLEARAQRLSDELEIKNRALENSLREKAEVENYLKTILESLPCGVVALDLRGEVTLCNPVAAEILQGTPELSGSSSLKRTGLSNIALRDYLAASVSSSAGGGDVEIPFVSAGQTRVLSTSGTPLRDSDDSPIGTLHIIRDVTEMKALQEQSKRGERLAAMGEMAVELAHEIRNPLGSIDLFASLLQRESPPGSDEARWAENIRVGSRSLNNIVSNMLHFASPLSPAFTGVDVHGLILEVLSFTEPITRQRGVAVEQRLLAVDSTVTGDRELLKQMMLNLIMNSLQAMPAHGSLVVETGEAAPAPGARAARGFLIRVSDTGIGIAPEYVPRIFDPFFTTNKRGTGLGLSVVHRIVERHAGVISVESRLGSGTTFTIVLPAAPAMSGAA